MSYLPQLPNLLDSLSEGCQLISPTYTYLYLNAAAAAQGRREREDLLGKNLTEEYPGIEQTSMFTVLRRCMEQRVPGSMENEFHYPDGVVGWFELRFEPVPDGVFILSLDITERKRAAAATLKLEDELRQAQKMETIGRLAGGVAHDFNNLLSVIFAYTDVALEDLDEHAPLRADLQHIREAADRAASLTGQLLAFSRKQVLQPRLLDLNAIVTRIAGMLQRLLGTQIELRVAPGPALGGVLADPVQIEQVILNLTANARDAMATGGTLTLSTVNVDLDPVRTGQDADAVPDAYVLLSVSDTGVGMDAAAREHAFEPFFTTKHPGAGTGLGLATVYGIVKQSGGHIMVDSEPGRGTTFRLYFPRREQSEIPK